MPISFSVVGLDGDTYGLMFFSSKGLSPIKRTFDRFEGSLADTASSSLHRMGMNYSSSSDG